jgi:hypothetical protein
MFTVRTCARHCLCQRWIWLAAITVPMLIGATASGTPITTWSYGGSSLQYVDNSGDSPTFQDYSQAPTVGTSPLPNGIKIFGTGANDQVFSLTGADYIPSPVNDPSFRGNQLVIYGTGTIDGTVWQNPGDSIPTTFGIGFDFTGGTLDIYNVGTSFTLYDSAHNGLIGVGSGFGDGLGVYAPGGYGVGWQFVDGFGSNYQTAQTMDWSVTFGFDWTGMAAGDTFSFSIPANSIDIQAVPEPACLALLGISGLAWLGRLRPRLH